MKINFRMMFGSEPESWLVFLIDLAAEAFEKEMSDLRFGERTRHLAKAYFDMKRTLAALTDKYSTGRLNKI